MKERFLVIMQRWGDPENHSYCIGIASNQFIAKAIGWIHHYYRGGKYDPELIPVLLPEQATYYLTQQFNHDRTNLIVGVCLDELAVENLKNTNPRSSFEVSEEKVQTELSEEEVNELHAYIGYSMFTEEDRGALRDIYEKQIRAKLNL